MVRLYRVSIKKEKKKISDIWDLNLISYKSSGNNRKRSDILAHAVERY